ncbi:hypothetical protein EYF80_000290 [Liparis tanakae]|uniref:Uncharacterized protein n=1 Tax=Liparis tanakae TaxID=230148 RepID=A0A4Z2JI83_9TELE|nr:hypothetical protein EYF80_000290 [Liparis tanakae]
MNQTSSHKTLDMDWRYNHQSQEAIENQVQLLKNLSTSVVSLAFSNVSHMDSHAPLGTALMTSRLCPRDSPGFPWVPVQ